MKRKPSKPISFAGIAPKMREHLLELARCFPEAERMAETLTLEAKLADVGRPKAERFMPKDYPLNTRERDIRHDIIWVMFWEWEKAGGEGPGISTDVDGEPYGEFLDFVQEVFDEAGLKFDDWRSVRRYITGH